MSDILTNIETRPSANSYKISASVESVVIEGASVEYSLIPIITSDNILKGMKILFAFTYFALGNSGSRFSKNSILMNEKNYL